MLAFYLWIKSWLQRQEGQDLAEYALLIGLIALIVVAAVTLLGTGISNVFNDIATEVGRWFGGT